MAAVAMEAAATAEAGVAERAVAAMAAATAAEARVVATAKSKSPQRPAGTPAPAAGLAAAVACMVLDYLGRSWLTTVGLDADPHRGWQPRTTVIVVSAPSRRFMRAVLDV